MHTIHATDETPRDAPQTGERKRFYFARLGSASDLLFIDCQVDAPAREMMREQLARGHHFCFALWLK